MYQDADEADDVEMDSDGDSEEEIQQIPISKTKRKKVDYGDEDEMLPLDDSVSDQSSGD